MMKRTCTLDSLTMLELRLKERGINLKKTAVTTKLTAQLTVEESNRLNKLAEYKHIRTNDLVNTIIKNFTYDFEDIKFFHGVDRRNILTMIKKMFTKPEDRIYVTFNVNEESSNRITAFRSKYDMFRGLIITHMIKKYLRDNK